jgi:hypothetical protein
MENTHISFPNKDLYLVDRMITYFHTMRYPEPSLPDTYNNEENAIIHAKMYVLALELKISRLAEAAVTALSSLLGNIDSSSSSMSFITELLQFVYEKTSPSDGLRYLLQAFITEHKRTVLAKKRALLFALRNRDFGKDLARILEEDSGSDDM